MIVRQAYRFELDPNDVQKTALKKHAGTARYAYNWGLEQVKEALDARAQGADARIPTAVDLHRRWNRYKKEHAPWWTEVSKCAPQEALRDLGVGLKHFFDSRAGARKGRKVGFPRFRKRGVRDRFRYSTGSFGPDGSGHVKLPRVGRVRTKEPTTKLLRRLEQGDARITSATVSRRADRWFVSLAVEVERATPTPVTGPAVGVDRGISCFMACSDGTRVASPRPLEAAQTRLRRANRALHRKQKGSSNRAKAARRVGRLHYRVACQRRDFLHKVTTELARTKRAVVIEDLHTAGLVQNRHLARHIADQGWGEFARMLAYKCAWYGSTLVVADRFYPSSKTCSECGAIKESLELSCRTYRCEVCGAVTDRDLNAALNLARLAGPVAASAAETQNACGGGRYMASGQVPAGEAGTERAARRSVSEPSARSEVLEVAK